MTERAGRPSEHDARRIAAAEKALAEVGWFDPLEFQKGILHDVVTCALDAADAVSAPLSERTREALRALVEEWRRRADIRRGGMAYQGGTHASGLSQAAAEVESALAEYDADKETG